MSDFLSMDEIEDRDFTGWLTRPGGALAWRHTLRAIRGDGRALSARETSPPWLVSGGAESGIRYAIMKEPRLLADFDRVAQLPSQDAVLRFANCYGWLERPRRLRRTEEAHDDGPEIDLGESYRIWRDELAVWRRTRELWRAALDRNREVLGRQIRWENDALYWTPEGDDGPRWPIADDRIRTAAERRMLFREFGRGDLIGPARWIVLRTVNGKLRDRVGMLVVPFRFTLRSFPRTLLGAIYLRFAIELASGKRERPCDECRLPFAQGNRRKRFCSDDCRYRFNYRTRPDRGATVSSPVSNGVSSTPV
jgi:hypothetical protein